VQGDNFYIGGSYTSTRVNSNTMAEIQTLTDSIGHQGTSSFVPIGTDYMVKSNRGLFSELDAALTWYKISTNTLDGSQPNYSVGFVDGEVMVYKNGATEIPISRGSSESYPAKVASPTWSRELDRTIVLSMISGDEVILIGNYGQFDYGSLIKLDVVRLKTKFLSLLIYNLSQLTGTINSYHNFTSLEGGSGYYWYDPGQALYLNGELIGAITVGESSVRFAFIILV
jgi:hypothetical protein